MNNRKIGWFSIGTIAALLTILSIVKGWWAEYKESPSSLKMMLFSQQVINNDERSIFVCFSDTSQNLNGISVTPVFDNSSGYPFNGFDLRYSVDIADGEAPVPNALFDFISINQNSAQYKYKENVLSQFSQTYEPFQLSNLPLKDSRYIINAKASYSGSEFAYQYKVRLWLRHIPKRPGQSVNDWKLTCKDKIRSLKETSDLYDVFFFCDNQVFNEFGVDFGAMNSVNVAKQDNMADTPKQPKKKNNAIRQSSASVASDFSDGNTSSKTVKTESSKDSYLSEAPLSEEKNPAYNSKLEYTAFSTFKEDDICYLSLTANQVLSADKMYYVIYHNKDMDYSRGYEMLRFKGNNKNTVSIKLHIPVEVDYVAVPEESIESLGKVKVEKEENEHYSSIRQNNDFLDNFVASSYGVEYVCKGETNFCVIGNYSSHPVFNCEPSDISILKVYTFPLASMSIGLIIFMTFMILGIGAILAVLIYNLITAERRDEDFWCILFEAVVFLLVIVFLIYSMIFH